MVRDTDATRRTVLKTVGAGAALGTGALAGGTAGARRPPVLDRKKAQFADATRARWTLAVEGGDVLDELAARGYLDAASLDEFATDEVLAPRAFGARDAGLHVGAFEVGGEQTAHLVATTRTDAHEVALVVQPHRDHAFARVRSLDDGATGLVYADSEVEPTGPCWFQTTCRVETCGVCIGTEYEEECCEQGGVTTCETVGPTGDCCGQKDEC